MTFGVRARISASCSCTMRWTVRYASPSTPPAVSLAASSAPSSARSSATPPSASSTVIAITWSIVLPYLIERVPALSLATMPPIVARSVVETSGVNCRPHGARWALRRSRTSRARRGRCAPRGRSPGPGRGAARCPRRRPRPRSGRPGWCRRHAAGGARRGRARPRASPPGRRRGAGTRRRGA
jgi:hypothetical protein